MKQIVITGGTGGIGRKISKAMVEAGHAVVVWGTKPETFEEVKEDITKNQELFSFQKVDVSDAAQVAAAAKQLVQVDVLINAAAVLWPVEMFLDTKLDELRTAVNVNLFGTVNACYSLLPLLQKSARGKIINFGGGGAADGRKSHMAYSISKTAVVRFTENISLEYPEIDANVIAPGRHKTDMWKEETYDPEPKDWADSDRLIALFNFLMSEDSNGVQSKFINYRDDWDKSDFVTKMKQDPDFLTLRRVDDFKFTAVAK